MLWNVVDIMEYDAVPLRKLGRLQKTSVHQNSFIEQKIVLLLKNKLITIIIVRFCFQKADSEKVLPESCTIKADFVHFLARKLSVKSSKAKPFVLACILYDLQ